MNTEIYDKRFLKSYTLAIIKVIEEKKFNIPPTKEIVDADLIPKLTEELMKKYILNETLRKKLHESNELNQESSSTENSNVQIRPVLKPLPVVHSSVPVLPIVKSLPPINKERPKIQDISINPLDKRTGFEKIKPLLDDFSVSRIQCLCANKPLIIIRSGQQQTTKIALTKENIHDVFLTIAELAHIPLIEGPIKISLGNYKIDGINSNIMDSKFIIQKNTAYSLLEGQR
jgi:hypothetical protein